MYESTRGNLSGQTGKQTIALGMVPGGGLFVPAEIPGFAWRDMLDADYRALARRIMGIYLPDYESEVLDQAAEVYRQEVFAGANPAPMRDQGEYGVLELWHGPTAAFKDMALQALPHLLSAGLNSLEPGSEVLILVATSGDTGKAALEGFKNVPGTHIVAFYPAGGVSIVQERQMLTTGGSNTHVVAVEGNFDQCQTTVKEIFASQDLRKRLKAKKMLFSSANSINWGRLLPQIVYYFWAYYEAIRLNKIKAGEPINVVVPTGNFGNILAGYYAKRMGLPVGKLICASNKNKILTDFFATGVYDSNRSFYQTNAPSMDILISSNFERFLFEITQRNAEKIRTWYRDLSQTGVFRADGGTLRAAREIMYAGWAGEEEILNTIAKTYREKGYLYDTHTAVAAKVYEDYCQATGDKTYAVIVATASPFKFAADVLKGLNGQPPAAGEWDALKDLSRITGREIPPGLTGLEEKPEKVPCKCRPDEISAVLTGLFNF